MYCHHDDQTREPPAEDGSLSDLYGRPGQSFPQASILTATLALCVLTLFLGRLSWFGGGPISQETCVSLIPARCGDFGEARRPVDRAVGELNTASFENAARDFSYRGPSRRTQLAFSATPAAQSVGSETPNAVPGPIGTTPVTHAQL